MPHGQTPEFRFWAKVRKGTPRECWPWTGAASTVRTGEKYGRFWFRGRLDMAHRASFILNVGPVPPKALVRHSCDNPICVNPAHLLVGTHTDNMRDRSARGRWRGPVGSKHPRAKLDEVKVRAIKGLIRKGVLHRVIAGRYSVDISTIHVIAQGRSWKSVK